MQSYGQNVPTILVVDDSWTELSIIAAPLYASGFQVLTAVDGDEAIEKALATKPSCIILDVVLPKQSGFQVCRKLRATDVCHTTPIILLSSKNTPQDRHWGIQQGANIYLTKPFVPDELVASIRSLL